MSAAVGTAIPKTNTFSSGRASIKQVKRAGNAPFNGPLSVFKTYLKYKTPIPDWLYEAVQGSTGQDYRNFTLTKRTEGSAVTTPSDTYDDSYLTPVSYSILGGVSFLGEGSDLSNWAMRFIS